MISVVLHTFYPVQHRAPLSQALQKTYSVQLAIGPNVLRHALARVVTGSNLFG